MVILGHVVRRRVEVVRVGIRVRALGVGIDITCRIGARRRLHLLGHHLEHVWERLSLDSLLFHHILEHFVELHGLLGNL